MNRLTWWSMAVGITVAIVYLCVHGHRKKCWADSATIFRVFLATASIGGAVRLIGFVLYGSFKVTVEAISHSAEETWWSLNLEDGTFVVLGGFALGLISCQEIWKAFADIGNGNGNGNGNGDPPSTSRPPLQ